ncbi:hypothetical protein KR018_007171, partial [Drosophila ironensis]
ISDLETLINVVKSSFGTGCLAMPQAFSNSGWLTGLVSTFVVSIIVVYSMNILLRDTNRLRKMHGMSESSYRQTMELAIIQGPQSLHFMAKPLGYLVDFLMVTYHFGVVCVYVVFVAKSIKYLCDLNLWILDERLYMASLTVPLVLLFLIRNFKHLVPFALLANIVTFIGLSSRVIYTVLSFFFNKPPTGFLIILTYLLSDLPDFRELQATESLWNWPYLFGTVLFAIESVGVLLVLEQRMQCPDHYLGPCGVLNQGMAFVIAFYMGFGFLGYWRYGQDTGNSILLNLPPNDFLCQLVVGTFAFGIFISTTLQGSVSVDVIWRGYLKPKLEDGVGSSIEFLVRIAIVLASVLVAIEYPDFGLLLSLIGSFCLAQLALIFPGIINICAHYVDGYGTGWILLWRSLGFIFMGLAGGVAGTLSSVTQLNDRYPI